MSGAATTPVAAQQKRSSFDPHGVLNELEQRIQPVRTGPLYRLGLLLVTIAMLLLPLVYVALVGLVAYAVYLHAVKDADILTGPGVGRAHVMAYFAPLIIGGVFLAFLAKPLFARRIRSQRPLTLARSKEPLLFAFVDQLSTVVVAPKAARIEVDCQANASASFGRGLSSIVSGELVLTIGLPLVGGMDLRQFTGVLAHELGHFSQGTAMRMTFIIRSVNAWFARVVYERDAWDRALERLVRTNQGYATLFAIVIKLLIWLTRRVLWLLMVVGHTISCFMLRQMEFDADRYEARVSGSDCFAQTSDRVAMLAAGTHAALASLMDAWRERRLCDDLPTLINDRETEMPEKVREEVRKLVHERQTRLFDTHPSTADRIASVQKDNAPGIVRRNAPATILFSDFAEVSKDATMLLYMQALGKQVRPEHVVPTETIVQKVQKKQANYDAARRFFQGLLHPARPVFPEALPAVRDESRAAEELLKLRSGTSANATSAQAAAKAYAQAQEQIVSVARVKAAATSGMKIARPAGYTMPTADQASISQAARTATATLADLQTRLSEAIAPAMRRLEIALGVERARLAAQAAPAVDSYDIVAEAPAGSADAQLGALHCLRLAYPTVELLRTTLAELGEMLRNLKQEGSTQMQISAILSRGRQCRDLLVELHNALRTAPYPYEHTEAGATIARYALRTIPADREVGAVYQAAGSAVHAVYELYMRLMSDLAQRAEEVERSLGLDPLPAPVEQAGA